MTKTGTLYIVSTPIGNLEDITLRALRILREVSRVACEDTRRTRKLLTHHGIQTPTIAFHAHNEKRTVPKLLRRLQEGEDLALVSDSGTPAVSDPGFALVREAIGAEVAVVPVPGASALLTALVAAGIPTEAFTFFGFLPHRSGERQRFLESIRHKVETLVFFDSPRRVADSLGEMERILGDRPAVVCRELTKIHEEFLRAPLSRLAHRLRESPPKGEVTLVVAGSPPPRARNAEPHVLRMEVEKMVAAEGLTRKEAIRELARRRSIPRREVYRALHPNFELGREREGE